MATAPRPGSRAEAEAARKFIRLRVKEREMDLMTDLTIQERFVVRAATGLPFEAFLPAQQGRELGEDSLFIIWWVARRQNGEANLAFAQAEREWPKDLTEDDLDFTIVDLDGEPEEEDSPEGSGPASEL